MSSLFKIILVDDLKDNLIALEALVKRDDVEIIKAESGEDALRLMMTQDFALALIDVQMPNMNGFELAELMRGSNKTKNIPLIFVTATARAQNFLFKGYESGAVDFLLKPLDAHAVNCKINIFIELERSKREQKDLLLKLTQTQKNLEQVALVRDEFMAIASHELKTPLTSLKLQAQLRKRNLQKKGVEYFTPETMTKMFNDDERQLQRITHLIDDMLDISRISSGKLSMNFEQFNLGDMVKDLVERNQDLFLQAECPIELDISSSIVGNWDRFRIEQVVMNLITNAMRYGQKKPILVQVRDSALGGQIIVKDNGNGIAIENQQKIFLRFERVGSGQEITGLGLGLYIVKKILEAHKGSIQVMSKLGDGATFLVELPHTNDT